ncbi:MAG TPA: sugar ABC transporter substrate-binding protein [Armatimonadota bacterium]|jgi:multiple sugar transport system substrate-binding protein
MKDPNRFLFPVYVLALLLVAAGFIAGMLGSGRHKPDGWNRKPGEIVFCIWGGPEEREVFGMLVDEFMHENPDIRVRIVHVPQNYIQKLQIMVAGGTAPDVFFLPDADFPAFVVKKTMMPLDGFISKSSVIRTKDFWPTALTRYSYDGRRLGRGTLYALPKDIGPFAMFYNKDLFRKAGLPYPSAKKAMTWDEAVSLWKKLTIPDRDHPGVIEQFGVANYTWESAVWSNGGEVLSPDGRRFVMADDARSVEALQWVADLGNRFHCAPSSREARSFDPGPMFDTGKLACLVAGRWNVPHYRKLSFDWDVAPIPMSPRARTWTGWSGSVGLAMSRNCTRQREAWKLIEFLAGPHGQSVQAKTGFQIPNQRYLAFTKVFLQPDQRPQHAEVFIEGARNQRPGVLTNAPTNEWADEFFQRITPIWEGKLTAGEGLRRMKPYVQKGLDNSWQQDQ